MPVSAFGSPAIIDLRQRQALQQGNRAVLDAIAPTIGLMNAFNLGRPVSIPIRVSWSQVALPDVTSVTLPVAILPAGTIVSEYLLIVEEEWDDDGSGKTGSITASLDATSGDPPASVYTSPWTLGMLQQPPYTTQLYQMLTSKTIEWADAVTLNLTVSVGTGNMDQITQGLVFAEVLVRNPKMMLDALVKGESDPNGFASLAAEISPAVAGSGGSGTTTPVSGGGGGVFGA